MYIGNHYHGLLRMTLKGMVSTAEDGSKGFDCNQVLSDRQIADFKANDFKFAIRYIPRITRAAHDLTRNEAERILAGGLGLGVVQHVAGDDPSVKGEGWLPSSYKGKQYAETAVAQVQDIGFPMGMTVWCDLEGVDVHTPSSVVTVYCKIWFDIVDKAGYNPGLYCGWQSGLSGEELYNLPYRSYWRAFNLNRNEYPMPRGFQLMQGMEKVLSGVRYDPDISVNDGMNDRAWFLWPSPS